MKIIRTQFLTFYSSYLNHFVVPISLKIKINNFVIINLNKTVFFFLTEYLVSDGHNVAIHAQESLLILKNEY